MSNVLWAFAKLEARVPTLLEAAGAEVVRRADEFSARDMAEVLWAFAKLSHNGSPDAVEALIARMEHILRSGGAPDIAKRKVTRTSHLGVEYGLPLSSTDKRGIAPAQLWSQIFDCVT